jgi:prepilin-type N-terminal cleavage/methylation domain-containing protein
MKGFTLVELVISVAIFAVMTALVIAKYGTFNQNTILTNMAYDMALTIRTAQTYGLSVKSNSSNVFSSAYGIHFAGNDNTHFTLYTYTASTNAGGQTTYALDQSITKYTITQGAKISQICLGIQLSQCSTNTLGSGDQLDIIYKRPNPNAIFSSTNSALDVSQPITFVSITSQDGSKTETVYIRKNGQISVGN